MKSIRRMRRRLLRGTDRANWAFFVAAVAYNLVCFPPLLEDAA